MKEHFSCSFLPLHGLYTDFYELVMAESYFRSGQQNHRVCFDFFFRGSPFKGSYAVFAGLEPFLKMVGDFTYPADELKYLEKQGFSSSFLDYLKDFRFRGTIHAMKEGEIVFPEEPIIRVEGNIIEAQLIETLLLNTVNYQTLVATKARRIRQAAGNKPLLSEFGLRRAPSLAGLFASRASIIGGFDSTSNVAAARLFNLKAVGTMAHSFIQQAKDELSAFRQFARFNPDNCILLVDTYDTLTSGLPHAIQVAREMEKKGHRLKGIRIDSGDPLILSRKCREILDKKGLAYVKIAVSNQLDEEIIRDLTEKEAPIDLYGVGTNLVTGYPDAALDGVYKLSAVNNEPRMKFSDNNSKTNPPGVKKVRRYYDKEGRIAFDGILLNDEDTGKHLEKLFSPSFSLPAVNSDEDLMHKVMEEGEIKVPLPGTMEIARYAAQRFKVLPEKYKTPEKTEEYSIRYSQRLLNVMQGIIKTYRKGE